MPFYDYKCKKCGNEWEDLKQVRERHDSFCKCGWNGEIVFNSPFNTTPDLLFQFTDIDTFKKPTEVHGKAHWKRLMREHGVHDDVNKKIGNKSYTGQNKHSRKELEKTVSEALKEKHKWLPKEQFYGKR